MLRTQFTFTRQTFHKSWFYYLWNELELCMSFRFKMIQHERDSKNPVSKDAGELLNHWKERMPYDGINSLETTISDVIPYTTHLRIKIKTYRNVRLWPKLRLHDEAIAKMSKMEGFDTDIVRINIGDGLMIKDWITGCNKWIFALHPTQNVYQPAIHLQYRNL